MSNILCNSSCRLFVAYPSPPPCATHLTQFLDPSTTINSLLPQSAQPQTCSCCPPPQPSRRTETFTINVSTHAPCGVTYSTRLVYLALNSNKIVCITPRGRRCRPAGVFRSCRTCGFARCGLTHVHLSVGGLLRQQTQETRHQRTYSFAFVLKAVVDENNSAS